MLLRVKFRPHPAEDISFSQLCICAMLCLSDTKSAEQATVMRTARIIQFGEDICHRLKVLKGAGYVVAKCESITEIESWLHSSEPPDAVVVMDEFGKASRDAVFLAKGELSLPVILFATTEESHTDSSFDLVIPVLTSPETWLARIEETITRSRSLRGEHDRHAQKDLQLAGQA